MIIERDKLPTGEGQLKVLLNGEHELEHRIVDGDLIVEDALVPKGGLVSIIRTVEHECPVRFNPAASMPTPVLLNRLIAWGVGLVNQLAATVQARFMRMAGASNGPAFWDCRGITVGGLGAPMLDTDACTLGLARFLAEESTKVLSKDIDSLAKAVSIDLGDTKAYVERKLSGVSKASSEARMDVMGLQDYIRKTEADIRQELLMLERSVAKRLVAHAADSKELRDRLAALAAEKPKAAMDAEGIEGLAAAVEQELSLVNRRLQAVESTAHLVVDIRNSQAASVEELRGGLKSIEGRLAVVAERKATKEAKVDAEGIEGLAAAMAAELELIGKRLEKLENINDGGSSNEQQRKKS